MNSVAWVFVALLGVALVQHAVAQNTITQCFVSDLSEGTIYYSYDSATNMNNKPIAVMQSLDSQNNIVSPLFQIELDTSTSNYELECWENLKLCKAHLWELLSPARRQFFFGPSSGAASASLGRVQVAGIDGGTFVDCYPVGRVLDFINDPVDSLTSFTGAETDFGGVNGNLIGIQYWPVSITPYLNNNNLQGLTVSYGGGNSANFGNTNNGDQTTQAFSAGNILSITLYYTLSISVGTTCGLAIDYADNTNDYAVGCSTFGATFTISNGFDFAGFMGYHASGDNNLLLFPLENQRMQPKVFYYGRTHNSVTAYVNAFFTLTSDLSYSYTLVNGIDTSNDSPSYSSVLQRSVSGSQGDDGQFQFQISADCGCVPVNLTVAAEYTDDSDVVNGPSDQTTLWSFGYEAVEFDQTNNLGSGQTYGATYETYSQFVSPDEGQQRVDKCPEMFLLWAITDLVRGQLYIDGLLGDADASSATAYNDTMFTEASTLGPFNTVIVSFDNNNAVQALSFGWNGGSALTIGDTTGAAQSVTLNSNNPNVIVMKVALKKVSGSLAEDIEVTFGQPIAPCLIEKMVVPDVAGQWFTNFTNIFSVDDDNDADLYDFWLYIPVDYTQLRSRLNGYFLTDGSTYTLTMLPEMGEFDRATVVNAKFYHLQAEHTYNVNFWGEVDNLGGNSNADLTSVETVSADFEDGTETFRTPHGVRLECTTDGQMYEQVEYEAVPDPEIKTYYTADSGSLGSTVGGVDTEAAQQDQFSNYNFFHYDPNSDNYPKYGDFAGYPTGAAVYYSNTDSCIQGLALTYRAFDGSTFLSFVAGDEAGYNTNTLIRDQVTFTDPVTHVYGNIGSDGGSSCLSGIRFTTEAAGSFGTDDYGCIGPNDISCNTELFQDDQSDVGITYYLSGLLVSSDADGDYVRGIAGAFTYVDLPEVETNVNCILDMDIDWNYIRHSSWCKELNLITDASACAISTYRYPDNQTDTTDKPDQRDPDDAFYDGDEHQITYHQKLIRTRDRTQETWTDNTKNTGGNNLGLTIVRQNDWQANLFCYYNATGLVSSSFSVKPEEGIFAAGKNEFDFALKIYQDHTYSTPYGPNEVPIMLLDEPVYMAVTIEDSESAFYVKGFKCWASKTETLPAPTNNEECYTLSQETGCYQDDTFRWDTGFSTQLKDPFYFDAFAWFDSNVVSTAIVFIQCEVRACLEDAEDGTYCDRPSENDECASLNTRQRRDLSPIENNMETVITSTPIIIKRRDTAANTLNIERGPIRLEEGGVRMAAGLFSLFVTTMFFCVLVISYKVYKLRSNYTRLRTSTGTVNNQN